MKKYNIIYADPPWKFNNRNTGGSMNSGSANKYKIMNIKDICNLGVEKITADDCVLFMWWVGAMPKEAIKVSEAWGFKIVTMTGFTWVKLTVYFKLFFGMGFWTRQGSENCLIGIKGKPKRISKNVRSVLLSVIEEHSKKPDRVRHRIEKLMGDLPRIELFARSKYLGWDSYGDEIKNDIQLGE